MEKLGKFMAANTYQNISRTTQKSASKNYRKITHTNDSFVKSSGNKVKSLFKTIIDKMRLF